MRNFHLPLPEPVYRRLRTAAEQTNRPATTLARYAIESWLRQRRRVMVREAIAAYAARVAGTRDDFDRDLEAAALELGQGERPARKARRRRHLAPAALAAVEEGLKAAVDLD
jgi:hypothetical protein